MFQALRQRLRETFSTPEAIEMWLMHPNPYLESKTPMQVIQDGHIERVLAALEALDSGVFI
jgi:uncharacterized protein (DUF2384 family)